MNEKNCYLSAVGIWGNGIAKSCFSLDEVKDSLALKVRFGITDFLEFVPQIWRITHCLKMKLKVGIC